MKILNAILIITLILIFKVHVFANDDPLFEKQWYLTNNCKACLNMGEAWKYTLGDERVKITIAEIQPFEKQPMPNEHKDLPPKIKIGNYTSSHLTVSKDIVTAMSDSKEYDEFHDTKVSGIISAMHNNGIGIKGISPFTTKKVVYLQYPDSESEVVSMINNLIDSELRIEDPSQIFNFSIENRVTINRVSNDLSDCAIEAQNSGLLTRSGDHSGGLVVIAAGNQGEWFSLPANPLENLLIVGSVSAYDRLTTYSNYGSVVEVYTVSGQKKETHDAEPIKKIITTSFNSEGKSDYGFFYGTSLSAPLVSATASLMLSVNPELKASQLKQILKETADEIAVVKCDVNTPSTKVICINPVKALKKSVEMIVTQWAYYWEMFFQGDKKNEEIHLGYYSIPEFNCIVRTKYNNTVQFANEIGIEEYKRRMQELKKVYDKGVQISIANVELISSQKDEIVVKFDQHFKGSGTFPDRNFSDRVTKEMTFVLKENDVGAKWWYVKNEISENHICQ